LSHRAFIRECGKVPKTGLRVRWLVQPGPEDADLKLPLIYKGLYYLSESDYGWQERKLEFVCGFRERFPQLFPQCMVGLESTSPCLARRPVRRLLKRPQHERRHRVCGALHYEQFSSVSIFRRAAAEMLRPVAQAGLAHPTWRCMPR
jgi:hypothetical protein